ncbi:NAD(P)-dependent oxidoreductase [Bacillus sp. FJAT-49711]|uniref:NAD(P)-dependent oxidoreductase n=1 Tax=Bacillus sp. FJAT-49711 TaxID=2833585 RepID=UPI001BC966B1|nr:NAD(P)-dependent oxidoreductase [Bacillus sp. FJAT-49711]MBS4219514.1 NAD(P)-dependent oxidoreductase [Bacillus sp. FJAT-49711]
MTVKKVGFIGLGAMGLPMAKNLLKSGYELHISVHKNRKPVDEMINEGAIEHSSLRDVAINSDILIAILPTDKEMESVLLSDEVIGNLPQHSILIEMTSGSPAMMKEVNRAYVERGLQVLDAPVSGGTIGAEQGTLTVMAGGNENTLNEVRPVLEGMAKQIYLVGAIGAGKAIKAINQMLASVHMIAASEAAALGEELEIDKEMMKQVIGNSSGASWMFMNKIDSLSNRNFNPGFKLKLMRKDVEIAANEGKGLNLPFTQSALSFYQEAEKEYGELDFSAISKKIL